MSIENRRIRFATIDGLGREDLPLAMEVWRDDLRAQVWASRDMLKLATLFVRYMADARPEHASLSYAERIYQLDRAQIQQCLRQMQIYGAIEAYSLDCDHLKVAINLSILQRLRVLKCRQELEGLLDQKAAPMHPFPLSGSPEWLPEQADISLDDDQVEEVEAVLAS